MLMHSPFVPRLTAAALALGGLVLLTTPVTAGPVKHGALTIDHVWARATAKMARTGAAYMTITNTGNTADTLLSAQGAVSAKTELHKSSMKDGVMRMRQVKGGIKVPAGKTVMLKPGGFHTMLIGLKNPLHEGDSFPLTLNFAKAGSVTVHTIVKKGQTTMDGGKMKMPMKKDN